MSWYECPKCGRELTSDQAYAGFCKHCGDVVVKLCGKNPDGPLNLNKATVLELQRIVGFGRKAAECIVATRNSKKFTDVADILKVRAIGKKTYEKVKDRLCVVDAASDWVTGAEHEVAASIEDRSDEHGWQLYTEYRGDTPVAYRYGPSWVAMELYCEGGFKTPEEAKLRWLEWWEAHGK